MYHLKFRCPDEKGRIKVNKRAAKWNNKSHGSVLDLPTFLRTNEAA